MAKGILPDFCVGTGVATWVLGAVVAVRGVRASSGRVVLAVRTSRTFILIGGTTLII